MHMRREFEVNMHSRVTLCNVKSPSEDPSTLRQATISAKHYNVPKGSLISALRGMLFLTLLVTLKRTD